MVGGFRGGRSARWFGRGRVVVLVVAAGLLGSLFPALAPAGGPGGPVAAWAELGANGYVAGSTPGFSGDDPVSAEQAQFSSAVHGMVTSPDGLTLFVADTGNDRIRKIDLVSRVVSTVAVVDDPYFMA